MANPYAPFGFRVTKLIGSEAPNYAYNDFPIPVGYSQSIAFGDPVTLSGGYLNLYQKGGSGIVGIFIGCQLPTSQGLNMPWTGYYPANYTSPYPNPGPVVGRVVTDPQMIFEVQVNGGPVGQSSIGSYIDLYAGSSGQPTLAGMSVAAVDPTTISATATTLPFKIVGISTGPGYFYGYHASQANNIIQVLLNNPVLA
jgi:hypothetical protein